MNSLQSIIIFASIEKDKTGKLQNGLKEAVMILSEITLSLLTISIKIKLLNYMS